MIFGEQKPKWFALDVTVDTEAAEAVEYALNSLDALGTEINHLGKIATETVTVIGYFNELPDDETTQSEIRDTLRIYGFEETAVKSLDRREVINQDWLSEWKKHWKPTSAAGFIISPPWESPNGDGKIVVFIEPNMAFGTGTHETTRLCLAAIDENYLAGESFLDVGTGTGILSIAAAKINAAKEFPDARMLALDTDEDSVRIAIENAALNGVRKSIDFHFGSVSSATPKHDFVCANLTLDVIIPILGTLVSASSRMLVLSGILTEQEHLIISELARFGISELRVEQAGEWILIAARTDAARG